MSISADGEMGQKNPSWGGGHSIDARYHLPWFGGPVYFRIMIGRDRRPQERTREDSKLGTRKILTNILLFALGACLLYTAVGVALFVASGILL